MPKLSLERFREIKGRVAEIFDLVNKLENEEIQVSEEDGEKLEREIEQLADEVHSSNLSDIPFEEYEGFYDLGFDFSGTGANIDFNIIHDVGWRTVRLKGCNVRNFDFENQIYDEESFDEEFMSQHPDRFIDRGLPQEVRQRYYLKRLGITDIIRYNLYEEIENGRASRDTVKFFRKVKPDVARLIEPDLIDISDLHYPIISSLKNYEEEITEDVIKALITEKIEQVLSRGFLNIDTYKRMVKNPKIRAFMPEEQIIDFGENDELAVRYLNEELRKLESSESVILNFINDNAKTIKMAEMYQRKGREEFKVAFEEIKGLDDFRDFLESEVETKILSGALEYGESYIVGLSNICHTLFVLLCLKTQFMMYYQEKKTNGLSH